MPRLGPGLLLDSLAGGCDLYGRPFDGFLRIIHQNAISGDG